jgi:hypothetical protein
MGNQCSHFLKQTEECSGVDFAHHVLWYKLCNSHIQHELIIVCSIFRYFSNLAKSIQKVHKKQNLFLLEAILYLYGTNSQNWLLLLEYK